MKRHVVILSTADFDSAVWTNKQHLAVGLSESMQVTYINSMGLRKPRFEMADLTRVIRRLKEIFEVSSQGALPEGADSYSNINIINPRVVPFHGSKFIRYLNQKLVKRRLLPQLGNDLATASLWSFSPITYGLETEFGRVIYHSVDLLHTLPGVPRKTLLDAERSFVAAANHVIASSIGVQSHLYTIGAEQVLLWENVADVQLFSSYAGIARESKAIFAGNLTPTKINMELLNDIAALDIELVLAGPIGIDGTAFGNELRELLKKPNVKYIGNVEPARLALEFATCKVGLIPYWVNDYTNGVFPMKVYEYMAAGLVVVSSPITSVVASAPNYVRISPPETWAEQVLDAVEHFDDDQAANRTLEASTHSWTGRVRQAEKIVVTGGS